MRGVRLSTLNVVYKCLCSLVVLVFSLLHAGARFGRYSRAVWMGHLAASIPQVQELLLDSAFWFVPNLLFALALLLIFRRILTDVRMGFAFCF